MLHMRSTDDRTATARIRDAAITEFATNGVAATSVRAIATRAGVSPGLVIHHFGSKDDLRGACDEHVSEIIRELKQTAMAAGSGFDITAAIRSWDTEVPLARYLARTLVDGSPQVAQLVDEIVSDAVAYIAIGVETGLIKPSRYPQERAAILTIWSLGALVLHEHLERLIGVDITSDISSKPTAISAYMAPILEIYSNGFITETTERLMAAALVEGRAENQEKETA